MYNFTEERSLFPPLSAFRYFKPFNERVEGLSRCYTKTCAFQHQVQTDHFDDLALGG